MKYLSALRHPGVIASLLAAALFGMSTPLAKVLLATVNPWLLAGILYFGSGIGLTLYRLVTRAPKVTMATNEIAWFAGAIMAGGVVAPLLLMYGLQTMPASGASLLLNAEGVFTALLAWFVFKENIDTKVVFGMIAIVAGAAVLSWPGEATFSGIVPALAVLGACLMWGIDNNLTRKVSLTDAAFIASIKGLVAGTCNTALALIVFNDIALPAWSTLSIGMVVGFISYGVSLVLYVIALRLLGTARAGAYFSLAPFIGTMVAIGMGEPLTITIGVAGALMAIGLLLHLAEDHSHEHSHSYTVHAHPFKPGHADKVKDGHLHVHFPITHKHAHYPDAHHDHEH